MQVHVPDPAYTGSALARANFRLAVRIALGFVGLLWAIALLGWGLELERFGVRPREWIGLPGILAAPLLHSGFIHLIANSLPLLVLGTAMLHLYPHAALKVLPVIYLGPGIAVWLFAHEGVHVGASGLVYGLVSYIFVAGLIRRDRRAIAASLLVSFMYGTLAWGVLPIKPGVSWETHLAAALIGVLMALLLRHLDIPPRVSYAWEGAPAEGGDEYAHVDPAGGEGADKGEGGNRTGGEAGAKDEGENRAGGEAGAKDEGENRAGGEGGDKDEGEDRPARDSGTPTLH